MGNIATNTWTDSAVALDLADRDRVSASEVATGSKASPQACVLRPRGIPGRVQLFGYFRIDGWTESPRCAMTRLLV
jgi:hypothetical protein